MDRKLLTVKETAEKLGFAPQTIYNRLSKSSEKPFPVKAKKVGRSVRFDSRDVEAYLDSL